MLVGTAGAQVLTLAASPLLTRLYSPNEYGVLGVYLAVLGALSFFGSLNMEMAVPVATSDEEATAAVWAGLVLLSVSTVIVVVLLVLVGDPLLSALNAESLQSYVMFVPAGLLLMGVYGILSQCAYRDAIYSGIARTKLSQAVGQSAVSIGLGLVSVGSVGLILGKLVGQGSGSLYLFNRVRAVSPQRFRPPSWGALRRIVVRYKSFALYTNLRRYLGDITLSLPVLVLAALYGPMSAGLFTLASNTLQLPLNVLANAVSAVYFAESAKLRSVNPQMVLTLSRRLLLSLLGLAVPALVVLVAGSPYLFSVVFGDTWREAGVYAMILSWGALARFVFKPLSNIFDVFERQLLSLWLTIVRVAILIGGFGVCYWFGLSVTWALGVYSVTSCVFYVCQYLVSLRVLKAACRSFEA